jgi:hypothetical protein
MRRHGEPQIRGDKLIQQTMEYIYAKVDRFKIAHIQANPSGVSTPITAFHNLI